MNLGNFYFISNQYYIDFPDQHLMQHKSATDRPCFYAFEDKSTGLYWMIPISSQTEKYKKYYNNKIKRYKNCDTIAFGDVLGHEKAFLIQNMSPITDKYINNIYIDKYQNIPVRIDGVLEKTLIKKAKRVLALHRRGVNLIFPDVLHIESTLLNSRTDD